MNLPTTHIRHHRRSLWTLFPSSHYALLSLFFFAGLEVMFSLHLWLPLLFIGILLMLFVGIVLVRMEERGNFHPTQTILPILAAVSLTGFALFLPTSVLHIYSLFSACIFFGVLKYGAKQAYPTWNWVISLTILFVAVATILGWRFHLYTPIIFVVAGIFLVFFLISLQSLQRLTSVTSEAVLLALSCAFVLTEGAWVLQFLPVHYIVQTGTLTAMYYVLFHLVTLHFEGGIKRRDIVEYMALGLTALLMILATARWT